MSIRRQIIARRCRTTRRSVVRCRAAGCTRHHRSAGVDASGIELLAHEAQLLGGRRRRRRDVGGHLDLPADGRRAPPRAWRPGAASRAASRRSRRSGRCRGRSRRWSGHDPASRPRAGSARPARPHRGCRARSGSRCVSTNDRFDWRMITKTWRALIAISQAPPLPGSRVVGWSYGADDGRVDVAEAVDLGGAEEADVDQATLQVEAEQLEHAHDRGRAGHDRRVADAQWQPLRPRPEDAGLVDQLEVRRDGPLGEVDGDVRQADARRSRRAGPRAARAAATIIISDWLKPRSFAGPASRHRYVP